uniref:apolipoprotein A-IV-like n=1 Tax=Pristiophorus japonicus TaxID=55135 RepID=UPI00398E3230
MKILTVALVILVVKGTQGAVIPQEEATSNKSCFWLQPFLDLFNIGNDIAKVAVGILSQSGVAKSAISTLSNNNGSLDDFIENLVKELSSVVEDLQWKGVSISDHVTAQTKVAYDKLSSADKLLHQTLGNESYAAVHQKLGNLHRDFRQYTQRLSLIPERLNQTYVDTTHQLEAWHKMATPYTEGLRQRIIKQIEELRLYLSPMIHEVKENLSKLGNDSKFVNLIIMKILVVALMLVVVKGIEAHAIPGEPEPLLELAKPMMVIQNLSAIFENLPQNITFLTRKLQQRIETLGANFEKQAGMIRDRLSSMFEQLQEANENISKQNGLSIIQHLEILKKNMSQLDMSRMPANSSQPFEETMRQELIQKMEAIQEVFGPFMSALRGTFSEGVENLRKSISPGIQEIRKLVSASETMATQVDKA